MTRTELIAKVREFACQPENYENGWDVVVETYEDDEIAKVIGRVRTVQAALDRMAKGIEPYNERRSEVQALADHDPMVEQAIAFAEELATRPAMSLAQAEALYAEQEATVNPIPETFVQDVVEAETQAHLIANALLVGTEAAEKHASAIAAWEPITTESGAVFSPNNAILERHILDQRCYLQQYLAGDWSLGDDLGLAIGTYRDHAFIIRLMELELARRLGQSQKDQLVENPYPTLHPAATETGVVCGNCTHRDGDNQRVIVRHATPADVRDCYAARYEQERQIEGELEAERLVERHYEETWR